jgi:hypothetical protein
MYLVFIIDQVIISIYPTIAVADQATSNILKVIGFIVLGHIHLPKSKNLSEKSTISGKPNIPQLFLFMQQPVDIPQCLL